MSSRVSYAYLAALPKSRRAVIDAGRQADARSVYLIEDPSPPLGARIDIAKPEGNMIIDIGSGTRI